MKGNMEDELKSKREQKQQETIERLEALIADAEARTAAANAEIARLKAQEVNPEVDIEVQLTGKALRIKEITKLAKDAFSIGNYEESAALILEYGGLKIGTMKLLANKPAYQIINRDAKEILHRRHLF